MSKKPEVIRIRTNNLVCRETCAVCGSRHEDADTLYWFFVERDEPRDGGALCAHCAETLVADKLAAVGACGALVRFSESAAVRAAAEALIEALNGDTPTVRAALKAEEKRRRFAEKHADELAACLF